MEALIKKLMIDIILEIRAVLSNNPQMYGIVRHITILRCLYLSLHAILCLKLTTLVAYITATIIAMVSQAAPYSSYKMLLHPPNVGGF